MPRATLPADVTVGTAIRDARLHRGLNQTQVAAAIGTDVTGLSRIETGKRRLTERLRLPLAALLRADPETFAIDLTAEHEEAQLIAAFLAPRYQEKPGHEPRVRSVEDPAATITGGDNVPGHLVGAFLAQHNTDKVGHGADEPVSTVMSEGCRQAVVAGFLAQHNLGVVGHAATEPLSTLSQKGSQQQVVAAHLLNLRGSDRRDAPVDRPAPTATGGGNHAAAVYAFLAKYYGEGLPSQAVDEPLHTVTAKPRHGVVTVTIQGQPYAIVDIGMRMLTPRERFNAQGFRSDYVIDCGMLEDGTIVPLTLEQQGRMCGNSVCPGLAKALVGANYRVDADRRYREPADMPLFAAE